MNLVIRKCDSSYKKCVYKRRLSFFFVWSGVLHTGMCSAADGVVRSRGDSETSMEHSTVENGGDGTPSLGSGSRQDMKEKTSHTIPSKKGGDGTPSLGSGSRQDMEEKTSHMTNSLSRTEYGGMVEYCDFLEDRLGRYARRSICLSGLATRSEHIYICSEPFARRGPFIRQSIKRMGHRLVHSTVRRVSGRGNE